MLALSNKPEMASLTLRLGEPVVTVPRLLSIAAHVL